MPLTYQDIINNGIFDELCNIYDYSNATNARLLLISIGFQPGRLPQFLPGVTAQNFWDSACSEISRGSIPGGFESLIRTAGRVYPVFSKYSSPAPAKPAENRSSKTLAMLISGWEDPLGLYNKIRELVNEMGMPPDSVEFVGANQEGITLNLFNWSPEQALQLGKLIDADGNKAGTPSRSGVEENKFPEYMYWQLFVEGPDQSRFELNNIRASTKMGNIAQGVLGTQYNEGSSGMAMGGKSRRAVIDHTRADGSTVRCDPDKSLHDSNVQEGDTLHVAPESTAGNINPSIREEALARVRAQIIDFARSFPDFHVDANARHTPTEYVFHFKVPSFGPPPALNAQPTEIDSHSVFLVLSQDFPIKAPKVFWQTPIFHPNIAPTDGEVCLGELSEHYKPGMNFGELCQMLIDIAAYRNYAVSEGYNKQAQEWAVTEEGQMAIEKRGGKSVIHKIIDEYIAPPPRPIQIKRL